MDKTTTVYPVILTKEQITMLKQLVTPSLEYDDDGDLNIWAEDENAMNACQIYRQCELAEANELQFAWLSVYTVRRAWGGPEEGGWGYDHWNLRSTAAYDCVNDLVHDYNEQVYKLADKVDMPLDEAIDHLITLEWADEQRHKIDSSLSYMKCVRFKKDSRFSLYLVIEVTPGAESTIRRPIYR